MFDLLKSDFKIVGVSRCVVYIIRIERMIKIVFIFNGFNLNLLGMCQLEIYGMEMIGDIEVLCWDICQIYGFDLIFYQLNYEGQIVEWIYEVWMQVYGIIINLVVYIYIFVVICDVLSVCDILIFEVYLFNVYVCEVFW